MGERFKDKVVWITGGGTGIGRGLALAFGAEGAKVAVSGRRQDKLDAVVDALAAQGSEGVGVVCDVTEESAIEAAVREVVDRWGQLDVAIANAGLSVNGRVEELSARDWRRQFDVNVIGAAMTARYAIPELRQTQGRLALIGSVASFVFGPKSAPYCASKAAVNAMGEVISLELHGSGASCTTIHPGFVESDIARTDNQGVYHAEREDRRPKKLMWPADKAAKVCLRAIHRRRRNFVFTWHGRFGAFMGRHTPGFVHFVQTRNSKPKIELAEP